MVFKKIFKDGTHEFVPRKEQSLLDSVRSAEYLATVHNEIKQIDIYNDGAKLIASIYG